MKIRSLLTASGLTPLDSELLMARIFGQTRTWVMAHDDAELSDAQHERWKILIQRRESGEPLSYITGNKEFFGRSFKVNPCVLIPRPSTEGLSELALAFIQNRQTSMRELDTGIVGIAHSLRNGKPTIIADIGTGSGCIAITLALEGIVTPIVGVDLSAEALAVARTNAEAHGVLDRLSFIQADAAEWVAEQGQPFILVSNPPYIPDGTDLEKTVSDFEPLEALFSGSDGMEVIRPMLRAAKKNPKCLGVVIELREDQVAEAQDILGKE